MYEVRCDTVSYNEKQIQAISAICHIYYLSQSSPYTIKIRTARSLRFALRMMESRPTMFGGAGPASVKASLSARVQPVCSKRQSYMGSKIE